MSPPRPAFRAGSVPSHSVPGRRWVEVGKHHGWLRFVVGWYFVAVTTARQHRFCLRDASTAPHHGVAWVRRRPRKSVVARKPAWTFAACCRPCHGKARRCEWRGRDYSGVVDSGKPHVRGVAPRLQLRAATISTGKSAVSGGWPVSASPRGGVPTRHAVRSADGQAQCPHGRRAGEQEMRMSRSWRFGTTADRAPRNRRLPVRSRPRRREACRQPRRSGACGGGTWQRSSGERGQIVRCEAARTPARGH